MRALRIFLIIAVVLGGIFVAADRAALYFAESEAEERVTFGDAGGAGSTEVSIKGFPFLTQVAGKELDHVDVTVKDVRAGAAGHEVRISEIKAQLRQVTLDSGYSTATAARATGTAVIPYAALTEAADEGVTVSYGGDGKVKVTGSVQIPLTGKAVTRSVLSTVTLVGGDTVKVRADEVPGEGVPGLEDLVRKKTDFERTIGGLPDGLKLEKIDVAPDGLEISMSGSDVRLAG
ncbi:DUF2993 domain-containing protein [Streptomyces sp. NBC_01012]|uniref:LmeA family phospholipid-binding protein n=1 Tax=Streptomyces sp. NBC_01012 TaxID=2903717 RepID=UPI00386A1553|nr:DUF2993 domain-containing protein [Streptomyces sp. NBC_01012]